MSITCPDCHHTSHHPDDERHGYCGHCHAFTSTPTTQIPKHPRRCWTQLTATGHLCLTELTPSGLPGFDLCPHCGTWWGQP